MQKILVVTKTRKFEFKDDFSSEYHIKYDDNYVTVIDLKTNMTFLIVPNRELLYVSVEEE